MAEDECGHEMSWLVFIGWVVSYANEWEGYSNYFGWRGQRFPGIGPLLTSYVWPQSCPGTGGCHLAC